MTPVDLRPDVVTTYRMLRLAMAALAFAILLSAAVQTASQHCLLTSISAYRYTAGSTVFITGLVAVGVCLVALRGGTWTENLLLNLAGMFAPIVAIVAVPLRGGADDDCLLQPVPGADGARLRVFVNPVVDANNALITYFAIAALGFVIALVTSARNARRAPEPVPVAARVARVVGLVLAALLLVSLGVWRLVGADSFILHAHTTSAIAMFACVGLVIAFRTRPLSSLSRRWDLYRDGVTDAAMAHERAREFSMAYGVIAVVMLVSVVGGFAVTDVWSYRVIAVESVLLVAFIVFWLLQTWQLASVERDG